MKIMRNPVFLALVLVAAAAGASAQTDGYVAGLHPDRRPDGAPQVTEAARTPVQLERALRGIDRPVPGNVELIAATGNWWVPLRFSGMSAPYDPRGWHGAPVGAAPSTAGSSAR
jgi:hypothetical protein